MHATFFDRHIDGTDAETATNPSPRRLQIPLPPLLCFPNPLPLSLLTFTHDVDPSFAHDLEPHCSELEVELDGKPQRPLPCRPLHRSHPR